MDIGIMNYLMDRNSCPAFRGRSDIFIMCNCYCYSDSSFGEFL